MGRTDPLEQTTSATSIAIPYADVTHTARLAGAGYGELAQAVGHVESAIQKKQQEDALANVNKQASTDMVEWQQYLDQQKASAQPGADNFTHDFLTKFDDVTQQTLSNMPDDYSRAMYERHLNELRTNLAKQSLAFEADSAIKNRADSYAKLVDASAQSVARDPSQYESAMQQLRENIPDLGPDGTVKMDDYRQAKLNEAYALGLIQQNPKLAATLFDPTAKQTGVSSPADNFTLDEKQKYFKMASAQASVVETKDDALRLSMTAQSMFKDDLSASESWVKKQYSEGKTTAEAVNGALQQLRADHNQVKQLETEKGDQILADALTHKQSVSGATFSTFASANPGEVAWLKNHGVSMERVMKVFDSSSSENVALTPDAARYLDMQRGMAVNDPKRFLDQDVGDFFGKGLRDSDIRELITLRQNSDRNAASAIQLNKYLADPMVRATLDAAGVTKPGVAPKGDSFDVFAGRFGPAVEQWKSDNKRIPTSSELAKIAASLTVNVPTSARLFGTAWPDKTPVYRMDESKVAVPKTQEEFNAIPVGAKYINPADGKTYIKNGK